MPLNHPTTRKMPAPMEKKQCFDDLCVWIQSHLDQPIGWQELMNQSGLDFRTINLLFFKFEGTTPMTWIRRQRESRLSDQTVPGHAGARLSVLRAG